MSARPPLPRGPFLVLGLGRSGNAAGNALAARGEEVVGVDIGTPSELPGFPHELGSDGVALVSQVGCVIKSPGVPQSAPALLRARERGLPVIGELELAWRLLGQDHEWLVITGTNGKTTTTCLVGRMHEEAGVEHAVAGNVGRALSSLAGTAPPGAAIVCEASSFQLEDTTQFAPRAAVLLNLEPDHLDRHGNMESYRAAKLMAFARQGNDDLAVAPADFPGDLGGCARRVLFGDGPDAALSDAAGQLWWCDQPLIAHEEIRLRGAHNRLNAMAAAALCLARGLPPDAVREALRQFAGVPHRLEDVAHVDGVLWVNDSKATNVASTLVALRSFAPGAVHLILGGQAKGQRFDSLQAEVRDRCKGVYLIGRDADLIAAALAGAPLHRCGELAEAVARARSAARPGDVVLLSPACASFDQFADFEARGDAFRELARTA